MSTDTSLANPAADGGAPQAHPMRRFLNFWFAPADPSILGFIRVVAGLLVIYTHVAYTPDLTNFFGQDAWYDLAAIDRERHELPQVTPPLGWEDPLRPLTGAQVPEYPHRRKLLIAHLRTLVGDGPPPVEVASKLAYLERFIAADEQGLKAFATPGGIAQEGVAYLMNLAENPADRASQLAVLADESRRAAMVKSRIPDLPITASPSLAGGLSPDERAKLAADAEAFFRLLPANVDERMVVLRHYFEMGHHQRVAFLAFIKRLATASVEQRAKLVEYLSYWNVDPGIVSRQGSPIFSLWFHITDPASMYIAHGVILVVFVLFTLGVCTRVTSVLAWLAAVSYLHRSMQILFGMDTMMNLLLFYLMIGDSGAALSVDRLVRRYRAAKLSISRTGGIDAATAAYLAAPPRSVTAGFALRCIQVHFCFIYMASGLSKLKGNAWWNHNAYWDTLANPEFTGIYYHWYEKLLRGVVSYKPLYGAMAAAGVGFTFVAEIGVPFLVWTRLRPYAVMVAAGLHAGIAIFMGLVVFSLFMMTLLLCYIPGAAVRSLFFSAPAPAERVAVTFGPGVRQRRAASLLAAFDLDGRVQLAPGDGAQLRAEFAGRKAVGPAALDLVAGQVPLLKLIGLALKLPALNRLFSGTEPVAPPAPAAVAPQVPVGR